MLDNENIFILCLNYGLGFVLACLVYLCGSISVVRLGKRIFQLTNIKSNFLDSNKIVNVFEIDINLPTVLIILENILKGWLIVFFLKDLLFDYLFFNNETCLLIPIFFLGHLFPAFYQTKGEKGFATFLGMSFAINLVYGVCLTILWFIAILANKRWSVGVLSAVLVAPFLAWFMFENFTLVLEVSLLTLLSLYVHRSNIVRICNGIEAKIGKSN